MRFATTTLTLTAEEAWAAATDEQREAVDVVTDHGQRGELQRSAERLRVDDGRIVTTLLIEFAAGAAVAPVWAVIEPDGRWVLVRDFDELRDLEPLDTVLEERSGC